MLGTMIKYTENDPNIILNWDNIGIFIAKLAKNQSSELALQKYQNKIWCKLQWNLVGMYEMHIIPLKDSWLSLSKW